MKSREPFGKINLRWVMFSVFALSLSPLGSACDRNKEQIPPAAKTHTGTDKPQDYPSTRNDENLNPAVSGTNSETSRQDTQPPATPASPLATGR